MTKPKKKARNKKIKNATHSSKLVSALSADINKVILKHIEGYDSAAQWFLLSRAIGSLLHSVYSPLVDMVKLRASIDYLEQQKREGK